MQEKRLSRSLFCNSDSAGSWRPWISDRRKFLNDNYRFIYFIFMSEWPLTVKFCITFLSEGGLKMWEKLKCGVLNLHNKLHYYWKSYLFQSLAILLWQLEQLRSKLNFYLQYCWSFWEDKLNYGHLKYPQWFSHSEVPAEGPREAACKNKMHKTKGMLVANCKLAAVSCVFGYICRMRPFGGTGLSNWTVTKLKTNEIGSTESH